MNSKGTIAGLVVVALAAGGVWAYRRFSDRESADEGPDRGGRADEPAGPEIADEPGATASPWECQRVDSNKAHGVRRVPPCDDGDPGMLVAMKRALAGTRGPIAQLGDRNPDDRRFGSIEPRIRKIEDVTPFDARDSTEALRVLREMGADWILVSQVQPRILPWLSPTATTIRELLRDGIAPPSFHPRVIGRAHILYRVAPPLALTVDQRAAMTKHVRAKLAGERGAAPSIDVSADPVGTDGHRVFVSVRPPGSEESRGRAVVQGRGRAKTLLAALDAAIADVKSEWDGADKRGLPDDLSDALGRARVQIDVTHNVAEVTDRNMDEERLYRMIELGREGVFLSKGRRRWAIAPNEVIYRGIRSETDLVERVGDWNGQGKEAWKNRQYRFGRFETISWIERSPGGRLDQIYRGLPLVTFRDVTRERLVESLRLGAQFLVRNQKNDGQFRYLYKPFKSSRDDRWTNENNIVRHGLNPYTVLLVNTIEPDPSYVRAAKLGIGYTLRHLKRVGNRCYVVHVDDGSPEENAKMGTVAVTLLSILKLAEVADISEYEDEVQCLGQELLHMQEPSGDVRQYDVPEDHGFHGRRNTIFPGEIMFAFSRLYGRTREQKYKDAFDELRDFQQAWFERLEPQTEEDGIYDETHRVDLISFEPWGLMALDDMHRQTNDPRYVEWAYTLVEFMDGRFQFDLARSQYPDYVGGYFKTQLEQPAINSCGYTEGAAAAYGIAVRTGRSIPERRLALVMGLRFALQLQYPRRDALFYLPDAGTALGGFRYNLDESRVRNDYMYHAMSALAQGVRNLRPEDYPARAPIEGVPEILRPVLGE